MSKNDGGRWRGWGSRKTQNKGTSFVNSTFVKSMSAHQKGVKREAFKKENRDFMNGFMNEWMLDVRHLNND